MNIESNESSPFQALQNQVEVLREQYQGFGIEDAYGRKVLGEVQSLVTAIREDYQFQQEESEIQDHYQEIQRDIFLKWDRLEQQKAELREFLKKYDEEPYAREVIPKEYAELVDDLIGAIEDYQDELETTMGVLEFEESQHDDGIR